MTEISHLHYAQVVSDELILMGLYRQFIRRTNSPSKEKSDTQAFIV